MHYSFSTIIFIVALVNPICAVYTPPFQRRRILPTKTASCKRRDFNKSSGINNQPPLTRLARSSLECIRNEERGAYK